jgi:hypothetical protein
MSGTSTKYFGSTGLGSKIFITSFAGDDTLPSAITTGDIITDIESFSCGDYSMEFDSKKTLDDGGFTRYGYAGAEIDQIEATILREFGTVYTKDGTDAYSKLVDLRDKCVMQEDGALVNVVIAVARGNGLYEGKCYPTCLIADVKDGDKTPDSMQEYSLSIKAAGKYHRCAITHVPAQGTTAESWTISALS